MGALMRYSLAEVDEVVAGEPDWWPELRARLSMEGRAALIAESEMRGWAANAVMMWVYKDVKRLEEFNAALAFYAGWRVDRTNAIVDAGPPPGEDVARDTLRVKQAFNYAEKVDPANWGQKQVGAGGGVKVVLVNFVQDAQGRVIEGGINELEAATARVAVSEFSSGEAAQIKGLTQGE